MMQLCPMAHWRTIRASFRSEPKLAPGTPLYARLHEAAWSDNHPSALFDRLFDTKLKLNADAMGLDGTHIRTICMWIIWYLHFRECAADLDQKEALQAGNHVPNALKYRPPFISPVRNLSSYAWRLFSTNVSTPLHELADEKRLQHLWMAGREGTLALRGCPSADQVRLSRLFLQTYIIHTNDSHHLPDYDYDIPPGSPQASAHAPPPQHTHIHIHTRTRKYTHTHTHTPSLFSQAPKQLGPYDQTEFPDLQPCSSTSTPSSCSYPKVGTWQTWKNALTLPMCLFYQEQIEYCSVA
jgi:hypothetical protein